MKVNDLIKILKDTSDGKNLEIKFESYEWADDLENCEYLERDFDGIEKEKDLLVIRISR